MKAQADTDLLYEVQDGIGLVTFNRPTAHNALTFEMYDRLGDICGEVRLGGSVKAIIITGAGGRAFAAGTDISLFQDFSTAQQGSNTRRAWNACSPSWSGVRCRPSPPLPASAPAGQP